ncbi:LytTR family transcriptional regulator [Pseudoalteromonas sp. MMG013]|uniref:LytR/AlgR family response regulator transcription factor n=1 Tax=Pseudoalteromonas TaxID=53246 RepID=UPI001787FF42|nr:MULTISPECIES: LytTR family DNA-binding domain-containing protein [Pseudoalteromonas]MBQ4862395.1 LytTR family transcriptional regulator [Pseudoalteromonas sp. MMG013]
MPSLNHIQNYQERYMWLLLCGYIFINNTINATSNIMEAQRESSLSFSWWEPFVWEYSSAVSTLAVLPAIVWLLKTFPFNWQRIYSSVLRYFLASVLFSLAHVFIMVMLRKLIYFAQDRYYDFGVLWFELIYEYRKDLWGFIFLIFVIKAYNYIISQLCGEAAPILEGEEPTTPQYDRLLVKKLGKEFIVKVNEVDWLESSGNYVNLHIGARIYPLRATLTQLSAQLAPQGFCRIHRSYAVRLDAIDSITSLPSGDSEIQLHTGKGLSLSRRYKEQFKAQLKL